jgi:hypothetical protein
VGGSSALHFYTLEAEGMDGQRMVECWVDRVGEDGIQDGHGYDKAECCGSLELVGDVKVPSDVEERWGLVEAAGGVRVCRTHGMLHRRVILRKK